MGRLGVKTENNQDPEGSDQVLCLCRLASSQISQAIVLLLPLPTQWQRNVVFFRIEASLGSGGSKWHAGAPLIAPSDARLSQFAEILRVTKSNWNLDNFLLGSMCSTMNVMRGNFKILDDQTRNKT